MFRVIVCISFANERTTLYCEPTGTVRKIRKRRDGRIQTRTKQEKTAREAFPRAHFNPMLEWNLKPAGGEEG